MHPRSTRRARLAPLTLALCVALGTAQTPLAAQGAMRELTCRGVSGIRLRVDQDPSPRHPAYVVMALDYRPSAKLPGGDVRLLEPGTCSWNPHGFAGTPVEPGRVRFDVLREAQPWSASGTRTMDTTAGAARFFPDPISLPRYLNDPKHYWRFYVDDATNLSNSFGPMYDDGVPTYAKITGPVVLANDVRRDLLCRGGSSGLQFGDVADAGNNLARAVLTYRVSASVPGPSGLALSPGACAWTDRASMPREPGRIAFVTASNAQLKQTQSGSAVDRSATAAEHWPDVRSIPAYLADAQHYWKFTVIAADPDSALAHGAWRRDLTDVVATSRQTAGSTKASIPTATGPGNQVFRPGGAGSTTSITSVFDVRNVTVKAGLDGVAIRFEAAPNSKPTVTVTPTAGGAPIALTVGSGSTSGSMWSFAAGNTTRLARNTQYSYVISAPATANARANQKSGQFKTLGQRVRIVLTEIDLISDGDADSNGELVFDAMTCPALVVGRGLDLGSYSTPLDWGDGPHRISKEIDSGDTLSVPDHLRLLVVGIEDDGGGLGQSYNPPRYSCSRGGDLSPGRNPAYEWNSIAIDFDLTKYPGAKGGEQFYRRSKPLRDGSTLSFDVRGYIEVTRK